MANENEFFVVSVEDTKKYGIIQASIIGRIRMWCEYNKKNKVKDRFHNNEWWSGFMKADVLSEQLGIPTKTIEKHLALLIKSNVIIKDVFNKKKYDRTSWYRVNPFPPIEETHTLQKGKTISSNRVNGNTTIEEMDIPQMGEPIPVSNSISKDVSNSASITNSSSSSNDFSYINEYNF